MTTSPDNLTILKSMLEQGIVHFQYTKVDGTLRDAHGTLQPHLIPESVHGEANEQQPTPEGAKYTRYWDMESHGWRSFINDNLIQAQWSGKTFVVPSPYK